MPNRILAYRCLFGLGFSLSFCPHRVAAFWPSEMFDGMGVMMTLVAGQSGPVEHLVPLQPDAEFLGTNLIEGEGKGDTVLGIGEERVLYQNNGGPFLLTFPGGVLVADDVSLTAPNGCELTRYTLRVSGRAIPTQPGGEYAVSVALYDRCPGAIAPANRAGYVIPGSSATFSLNDDALRLLEYVVPDEVSVPLPTNTWIGVSFSRSNCGVAVGAAPVLGHSDDLMDFPDFACGGWFGGPPQPHASIGAAIIGKADCPQAYLGYHANRFSGAPFFPGASISVGDDLMLAGPVCHMAGYEVGVRGSGVYETALHSTCDGPPSAGTAGGFSVISSDPTMIRYSFDPPIVLEQSFWLSVKNTVSALGGPIVAGVPPTIGTTMNEFSFPESPGCPTTGPSGQFGAFHASVICLVQCGDGVVSPGEACDEGPDNSDTLPNACRSDCTPPRCGDGVRDRDEQCDDGNANAYDGCTPNCLRTRIRFSPY